MNLNLHPLPQELPPRGSLSRYGEVLQLEVLASHVSTGNPLTMPNLSDDYNLTIRQQPERAKLAGQKEKGMREMERRAELNVC